MRYRPIFRIECRLQSDRILEMLLFLDANILFSAAYRDGSPAALLFDLESAGRCDLMTSAFALDEAHRNIELKRPARLPTLKTLTSRLAQSPVPDSTIVAHASSYGLPDKDAPILAAALVTEADILVTGDRTHFGHLYGKRTSKLRVLTLADTLVCLVGDE